VKDTGLVGPHTFYPLPGRMLISALSNGKDGGGRTGLAEYTNDGKFIRVFPLPRKAPYGYDVAINPQANRMVTSGFTPPVRSLAKPPARRTASSSWTGTSQ